MMRIFQQKKTVFSVYKSGNLRTNVASRGVRLTIVAVEDKYSDIKFRENPSSGTLVIPCGQTDGQTDMPKLMVVFRNFANAPKTDSLAHTMYLCVSNRLFPSTTSTF